MIVGWVVGPLRGFNVQTPSSFPALVRPYKKPRLYSNPRRLFPSQDDPPIPIMLEYPVELRPVGNVAFHAWGHTSLQNDPRNGQRERFRVLSGPGERSSALVPG